MTTTRTPAGITPDAAGVTPEAAGATPDLVGPASRPARRATLPIVRGAIPIAGAVAAIAGVVAIWAARATVPHWVYVSELGATGAPTATAFAAALLAIAIGGVAIAAACGSLRSGIRILDSWPIAASIAASAVCFVVASQVTCTYTCPVPFVNPRAQPQDFVHIGFAVLGFALACYAMLQCAFVRGHRLVRGMSLVACGTVAVITAVGGVLAVLHVAVDLGAASEYAGMTVAIGWLGVFGVSLAFRPGAARQAGPPAAEHPEAQAPSVRSAASS